MNTPRLRRGFSLIETLIGVTVTGFLLSFLGFLLFFTVHNMRCVTGQVVSQSSAAAAGEFAVSELRRATSFARVVADGQTTGGLHRTLFVEPQRDGTFTTRALALNASKRELRYYRSQDDLAFDTEGNAVGAPAHVFRHLTDFQVSWHGPYRITIATGFRYYGFLLAFQPDGGTQSGLLTTDIIAKNHYLDQGGDSYASDPGTSGPATL